MVFWTSGVLETVVDLVATRDANVRLDQGQHYKAAALMRDAAEEAERIFIRELCAAGLTEEGLSERPRTQMENRQDNAHRNHSVTQTDRPAARPRVGFECLSQDESTLKFQDLTLFSDALTPAAA
jgi:hypothetical protein